MISISNAWGIFLIIFLLSYGLVEIPKYLLHMTNYDERLKYLEWKAKDTENLLQERKEELEKIAEVIILNNNIVEVKLLSAFS